MSWIGYTDERRPPVNGDRARNRDEEQQQRECGPNGRQIDVEAELLDQDIPRHAHVGIKNGCVETDAFRMVEIIESVVAHMHAGRRLIPIRTIMHMDGTDPYDRQGYADEPNEQIGVRSGHAAIVGGMDRGFNTRRTPRGSVM